MSELFQFGAPLFFSSLIIASVLAIIAGAVYDHLAAKRKDREAERGDSKDAIDENVARMDEGIGQIEPAEEAEEEAAVEESEADDIAEAAEEETPELDIPADMDDEAAFEEVDLDTTFEFDEIDDDKNS